MRIFRRRPDLKPLDEGECYARLHGPRSGEISVVHAPRPVAAPPPSAGPSGPTDESPALHLVIPYPRNAGRLTGEQVRSELLRRMAERAGEAA